ncbi:hypothetical protein DM02DRAFT_665383 [Periconia macrospinosa]|uniref:BZIP domain-containing protein n=1 Tax=Periconia macrospinosa TaxID=97972 RepID=A0A2V1CX09_9PLEO|nr:hypothetical protein DM02DRAFT_665383 [Periconia macrospinosa]
MAPTKYRDEAARREARKEQNRRAQRRFRANKRKETRTRTLLDNPQPEPGRSCAEQAKDPRESAQAILERVKSDIRSLVQLSHAQADPEFEGFLAEQWGDVQGLVRWRQRPQHRHNDEVKRSVERADARPAAQSAACRSERSALQLMRQTICRLRKETEVSHTLLWSSSSKRAPIYP